MGRLIDYTLYAVHMNRLSKNPKIMSKSFFGFLFFFFDVVFEDDDGKKKENSYLLFVA